MMIHFFYFHWNCVINGLIAAEWCSHNLGCVTAVLNPMQIVTVRLTALVFCGVCILRVYSTDYTPLWPFSHFSNPLDKRGTHWIRNTKRAGKRGMLMESCKWEINKKDAKKLTNSAHKMTNLSFEVIISKQGDSIACLCNS
jgi:hypothetical protein